MTHSTYTQQALFAPFTAKEQAFAQTELENHTRQETQAVKSEEITTVEISFYDHEIYAENKLIATITHDVDDFVTQRWVVMVNGQEIYRADTWAKCHSYIRWHYKQGTLPEQQPEVEPTTTGNEIMSQIATECEKFEFDIFDNGIYYNDTKLGDVGCTNGNWWVIRASCLSQRKTPCDSGATRFCENSQ